MARMLGGAVIVGCLFGFLSGAGSPALARDARTAGQTPELRALWVLRTSLNSPQSIAALVDSARVNGFNTLLVQVRGRGDAYYAGGTEPRAVDLARQPASFDPLAEVLRAAHEADIRVHAWINVNLVSSAVALPIPREHLVHRRPEWLMVPRELAGELSRVDPAAPAYVRRLAQWTRGQSANVEGLYASPIHPAAVEHMTTIVRGIARRYAVDGIHFDYARYPTDRFDYSRDAVREFRAWVEPRLPAAQRQGLTARAKVNVLAFPDGLPAEWRRFRVARMTTMMSRLRDAAKAERPGVVVSVAVKADDRDALEHRLQEWPRWLENGTVDAVAPMAYTTEPSQFTSQIAAARAAAAGRQVWAGIGAYRLTPAQTVANITSARRLGAEGFVLFSYDSLTQPGQKTRDYLAVVGRAARSQASAPEGSR